MLEDKKVLVIDDQVFMFNMLKKNFSTLGINNLEYADSGIKALEMLKTNEYDLITCDITMPEMDGIETTRRIFEANPQQRLIMVTAIGQESIIKQAIQLGVKHYLLKPFSLQAFADKISLVFS